MDIMNIHVHRCTDELTLVCVQNFADVRRAVQNLLAMVTHRYSIDTYSKRHCHLKIMLSEKV